MPRQYNSRLKLTPMPPTNRWRKIYHGKIHYVGIGHCSSKNDREGYRVALAEWQTLKQTLDDTPTPDELAIYETWRKPDPVTWDGMVDLAGLDAKDVKAAPATRRQRPTGHRQGRGKKPQKKDTIGSMIDEFVAHKMARHQMGELSAMRVVTVGQHLRTVEAVLGRDTPIESINEETVKQYWGALSGRVRTEKSAVPRLRTGGLFKEWITSLYQIPTPRNISRRDLSIPRPAKKVVIWTVEEVKSLLARARAATVVGLTDDELRDVCGGHKQTETVRSGLETGANLP